MATSIFGIKTIKDQPKARIELYLCGNIPTRQFSAEDVIKFLQEFIKRRDSKEIKELDGKLKWHLGEYGNISF
jgi:hypothetical protein